ncbi:MAG: magnesium transporter [Phycisphaerales bacterium]
MPERDDAQRGDSAPDLRPKADRDPLADAPSEESDANETPDACTVIYDAGGGDESYDRIDELIDSETATPDMLAPLLEEQAPADAADMLERMGSGDSARVLRQMEEEAAADALAHMDLALAKTVIMDLDPREAGELLECMDPDDAVDLLQTLTKDQSAEVLRHMPRRLAAHLGKLAQYPPESAGGLMNTDVLFLPPGLTVSRAIEFLRSDPIFRDPDNMIEDLYCLDDEQRLVGWMSLRQLLLAQPEERIADLMEREVDVLRPNLDREEVAREFSRYDHLSLPVIDGDNRLLGVVTVDDVLDIVEAEATEDAQKQVGVGVGESSASGVGRKLKGRSPWLIVNLFTSTVSAIVVLNFDGLISQLALLAVIMPVIANQAGNAGQQSLAVTLRGIVLGEVREGRAFGLLMRETAVGAISGMINGMLVFTGAAVIGVLGLLEGVNYRLGAVAWIAMVGALTVGCFAGSSIPLLMRRFGIDPATASTIFLTMLTDSLSFLTFLGLAYLLQGWLLDPAAAQTVGDAVSALTAR